MKNTIRYIKSFLNISSLSLFLFFVIMQLTTWIPLRYWHIWGGGNFIDSQQILMWSKCYETQGNLVFAKEGECSGYIYGSTLLKILSLLKVDVTATQIFGYLFMFVLAVTISFKVNTLTKYRENPFIILIVLSPPVLLLAERGNFDILMFALIGSAGLLFGRNFQIWALIPLALATLIKFYSLPLFLLFFLLNDNKKKKITTFVLATGVSTRVFLDFELIQSTFPSGYSWEFGASIWARYLTRLNVPDLGELVNNLSGLVILSLVVGFTLFTLKKRMRVNLPQDSGQQNKRILFYSFYATHLSCFMLGMNFDYRLIFLAMASMIYLDSFRMAKDSNSILILVLTLMSVWLTYPSTGLEPLGDLTTEVLTVVLGIRFLQFLKIDLGFHNAR